MLTLNNKHNSKKRRFGEFFTPLIFASKSFEYIKSCLGDDFLAKGNFRVWDCSCGSGNLIYSIDKKYHKYIYLSTLYDDDVGAAHALYPSVKIFQYDYLNDDVDLLFSENKYSKLPKELIADLNNKNINWLVYINPPYATSQSAGANSKSKRNVSITKIREYMHKENLGEVSRELYLQFLYRIHYEFRGKNIYLALFSKINYIHSNNNQKFREEIFKYKYKKGFLFSSENFNETSKTSPFTVAFALWDLNNKLELKNQSIEFDVLDNNTYKISSKKIQALDKSMLLNNWIERHKNIYTMPPLSSAIRVKNYGKDIRDKVSIGFIASLMSCGNDIQKQSFTAILSSPQASAGSMSITANNFEKAVIIFAVRKIVKIDWINSSEQFKKPTDKCLNDKEFILDCLIYALFHNSNQTSSLRNIEYKDKIYNIENNFFPFLIDEIKKHINSKAILTTTENDSNRFVATYIKNNSEIISRDANNLLYNGKELYEIFFKCLDTIDNTLLKELKIEYWDIGYFQIKALLKKAMKKESKVILTALKLSHKKLSQKIEKKIEYYGFI